MDAFYVEKKIQDPTTYSPKNCNTLESSSRCTVYSVHLSHIAILRTICNREEDIDMIYHNKSSRTNNTLTISLLLIHYSIVLRKIYVQNG